MSKYNFSVFSFFILLSLFVVAETFCSLKVPNFSSVRLYEPNDWNEELWGLSGFRNLSFHDAGTNLKAALKQIAVFKCSKGYTLIGDAALTCDGRLGEVKWIGNLPQCKAATCLWITTQENIEFRYHGFALALNSTWFPEGTELIHHVNISCATGYRLDSTSTRRYCRKDGTWSRNIPHCVPSTEEGLCTQTSSDVFLIPSLISWGAVMTLLSAVLICRNFKCFSCMKNGIRSEGKSSDDRLNFTANPHLDSSQGQFSTTQPLEEVYSELRYFNSPKRSHHPETHCSDGAIVVENEYDVGKDGNKPKNLGLAENSAPNNGDYMLMHSNVIPKLIGEAGTEHNII